MVSMVYDSDPRTLPVVYDCPACNTISSPSLLSCPRFGAAGFEGEVLGGLPSSVAGLGKLLRSVVGEMALKNIVGVSCEGD